MKRSIRLLFAILLAVCSLSAHAETSQPEGVSSFIDTQYHCTCWVQEDGTVFVDFASCVHNQGYKGEQYPEDWTLPTTMTDSNGKEYTVAGIATNSFLSNSYPFHNVKRMHLPSTYKTIRSSGAFTGTPSITTLEELDAPSVEWVGNDVFQGMHNLKKVNLPNVKFIGHQCFYQCIQLTELDFPNLEEFDEGGENFYGCTNLKHFTAPKLTNLPQGVFQNCDSLEYLDLPSVDTLSCSLQAIHTCTNLKWVNLPKVKYLGGANFYNCDNLKEIRMESLLCVDGTVNSLPSLERVDWPNLKQLKGTCFNSCPKLHYIRLQSFEGNLTENPLTGTTAIDTLLLPSAKTLGYLDVPNLKMLDIRSIASTEFIQNNQSLLNSANIEHIICNNVAILRQLVKNTNKDTKGQSMAWVPDEDFHLECKDYAGFDSVEIYQQTTAVNDTAFDHMPNIHHIVLHDGCTEYNAKAFYNYLKDLEDITVKTGSATFKDDQGVLYSQSGKLLYYPLKNENANRHWHLLGNGSEVTGVGPYALYNYKGNEDGQVRQACFGSSFASVEEHAMDGSVIDRVTFAADAPLKAVSDYAFANMTQEKLRYFKLPKALQTVGRCAFAGDKQVQAIEFDLPSRQLTSVADSAFAGITAITSIGLPPSVTEIGNCAFRGNTAMTYFTLPSACTTIGQNAFDGCTGLTQLNAVAAHPAIDGGWPQSFATTTTLLTANASDYADWAQSFQSVATSRTASGLQPQKLYGFSRSYPIDLSQASGVRFYHTSSFTPDANNQYTYILTLSRVEGSELSAVPANTPLLVCADDDATIAASFVYYPVASAPADYPSSLLRGSAGAIRLDDTDGDYRNYLLDNSQSTDYYWGIFYPVSHKEWYDVATRRGERVYMQLPATEAGQAKQIKLSFDETPTGIHSVSLPAADGRWYYLQGQQVAKPAHGVYLHNGRKVIVR